MIERAARFPQREPSPLEPVTSAAQVKSKKVLDTVLNIELLRGTSPGSNRESRDAPCGHERAQIVIDEIVDWCFL